MRLMVITEDVDILNDSKQLISNYAHMYTTYTAMNVEEFLNRDDINRFDAIFIGKTNQIHAIEKVREALPETKIVLINKDEIIEHKDVFRIINTPLSQKEYMEICQDLEKTITNHAHANVVVECFKSLAFKTHINARAPIAIKWRTMKAKELFAYLLVYNNEFQSKKTIQDMFWSDLSEKSVTQQLYSTVYEIRKTIETHKIPVEIINSGDKYMLKSEKLWIDYQMFEHQLGLIDEVTDDNYQHLKSVLELYKGHLLEIEDYNWAFNKGEELRFLWIIYMEKLRDYYIEKDNIHEAIILNLRMREFFPNNTLVEDSLNELYALIGEPRLT